MSTWKYRLFRLKWVDHVGPPGWALGLTYMPRDRFRAGDPPFRALYVSIGQREYVFDLGRAK